jgi:hypothetical protein
MSKTRIRIVAPVWNGFSVPSLALATASMTFSIAAVASAQAAALGGFDAVPLEAGAPQNARVFSVGAREAQALSGQVLSRVDAVSLDATGRELSEASASALRAWVFGGGVVFLHTDAARLFGYATVEARAGTARVPGLLFGSARAALPYTAHPLLWNSGASNGGGSGGGEGAPSAGVRRVFYRLRAGDHLVVQHPAGVPLLRVSDVASPNPRPLFAAAVAPYGRGWAVFTPFFVDPARADGALLAANLAALARSSRVFRQPSAPNATGAASTNPVESWVGVPARVLEAATAPLAAGAATTLNAQGVPLIRALDLAMGYGAASAASPNGAAPVEPFGPTGSRAERAPEPVLFASREEVLTLRVALVNGADEATAGRVAAALCLMRARLALQRSDLEEADRWIEAAARRAPQASEVLAWDGALAAARAEVRLQASPARARAWAEAARLWQQAAAATPLLQPAGNRSSSFGGPSGAALALWAAQAQRSAVVASAEPPLFSLLGRGAGAILVRHFPNDPTLRMALPSGAWLLGSVGRFGWRVEGEEILIFPAPEMLQAYRAASGGASSGIFNPLSNFGDVQGERILLLSQNTATFPVPIGPNGQIRFVRMGTAIPSVLARMHALLLVNALAEGGADVPTWITLGLNGLASVSVNTDGTIGNNGGNFSSPLYLNRFAAAGLVLGPAQFQALPPTGGTISVAEAQAANMVAFFYSRFGTGVLAETLQRIGDGQSADEALQATIGLSQQQFFVAWRNGIAPTG